MDLSATRSSLTIASCPSNRTNFLNELTSSCYFQGGIELASDQLIRKEMLLQEADLMDFFSCVEKAFDEDLKNSEMEYLGAFLSGSGASHVLCESHPYNDCDITFMVKNLDVSLLSNVCKTVFPEGTHVFSVSPRNSFSCSEDEQEEARNELEHADWLYLQVKNRRGEKVDFKFMEPGSASNVSATDGFLVSCKNPLYYCVDQGRRLTEEETQQAIYSLKHRIYPVKSPEKIRHLLLRLAFKVSQGYYVSDQSIIKKACENFFFSPKESEFAHCSNQKFARFFPEKFKREYLKHLSNHYPQSDFAKIVDFFNLLTLILESQEEKEKKREMIHYIISSLSGVSENFSNVSKGKEESEVEKKLREISGVFYEEIVLKDQPELLSDFLSVVKGLFVLESLRENPDFKAEVFDFFEPQESSRNLIRYGQQIESAVYLQLFSPSYQILEKARLIQLKSKSVEKLLEKVSGFFGLDLNALKELESPLLLKGWKREAKPPRFCIKPEEKMHYAFSWVNFGLKRLKVEDCEKFLLCQLDKIKEGINHKQTFNQQDLVAVFLELIRSNHQPFQLAAQDLLVASDSLSNSKEGLLCHKAFLQSVHPELANEVEQIFNNQIVPVAGRVSEFFSKIDDEQLKIVKCSLVPLLKSPILNYLELPNYHVSPDTHELFLALEQFQCLPVAVFKYYSKLSEEDKTSFKEVAVRRILKCWENFPSRYFQNKLNQRVVEVLLEVERKSEKREHLLKDLLQAYCCGEKERFFCRLISYAQIFSPSLALDLHNRRNLSGLTFFYYMPSLIQTLNKKFSAKNMRHSLQLLTRNQGELFSVCSVRELFSLHVSTLVEGFKAKVKMEDCQVELLSCIGKAISLLQKLEISLERGATRTQSSLGREAFSLMNELSDQQNTTLVTLALDLYLRSSYLGLLNPEMMKEAFLKLLDRFSESDYLKLIKEENILLFLKSTASFFRHSNLELSENLRFSYLRILTGLLDGQRRKGLAFFDELYPLLMNLLNLSVVVDAKEYRKELLNIAFKALCWGIEKGSYGNVLEMLSVLEDTTLIVSKWPESYLLILFRMLAGLKKIQGSGNGLFDWGWNHLPGLEKGEVFFKILEKYVNVIVRDGDLNRAYQLYTLSEGKNLVIIRAVLEILGNSPSKKHVDFIKEVLNRTPLEKLSESGIRSLFNWVDRLCTLDPNAQLSRKLTDSLLSQIMTIKENRQTLFWKVFPQKSEARMALLRLGFQSSYIRQEYFNFFCDLLNCSRGVKLSLLVDDVYSFLFNSNPEKILIDSNLFLKTFEAVIKEKNIFFQDRKNSISFFNIVFSNLFLSEISLSDSSEKERIKELHLTRVHTAKKFLSVLSDKTDLTEWGPVISEKWKKTLREAKERIRDYEHKIKRWK